MGESDLEVLKHVSFLDTFNAHIAQEMLEPRLTGKAICNRLTKP